MPDTFGSQTDNDLGSNNNYEERIELAALEYACRGFAVVPTHVGCITDGNYACTCGDPTCGKSAGKHPTVAWKRYQQCRPENSQVLAWFGHWFCGYNVGMVHGPASGTIVLDWDGDAGTESQCQLERELGRLPVTPAIITGSGGQHQLFKHPSCHIPTNKGLRKGFDVRGDGGFSVLPPSIHACQRHYEWDVDAHIDDVPLADLPKQWVRFIATASAASGGNTSEIVWTPAPDGTPLVTDGRETFMRDVVWKTYYQLAKRHGRSPTADELYAEAVANYAPYVDLKKPGRGLDQLRHKCSALLKRFASGQIKPKTELEKARDTLAWVVARKKELYSR